MKKNPQLDPAEDEILAAMPEKVQAELAVKGVAVALPFILKAITAVSILIGMVVVGAFNKAAEFVKTKAKAIIDKIKKWWKKLKLKSQAWLKRRRKITIYCDSIHIDIGGEGRYPEAINVNSGMNGNPPVTSGPTQAGGAGVAGRPIPNVVQASGEALPFRDNSIDTITLQNAPIRTKTISEIKRVLKPIGDIRLVGPDGTEVRAAHKAIAEAVNGRVRQIVVGEKLVTNIIIPKR